MPWVDENKCIGCNICVDKCPVPHAIYMKSNNKAYINNNICTRCGICIEACPQNAIRPNSENPSLRGQGFSQRQGFGKGQGRGMARGVGGGRGRGMGAGRGMGKGGY